MIPMLLAQVEFDLDWSQWIAPFTAQGWQAAACSALVGIACGLLGCFVVLRRMAFIGDALSHAILPGVVVAFLLTGSVNIAALFFGALLAGITTTVLVNLISRYSRTKEDSAIGITFTLLFALGIVLASAFTRGTHFDIKDYLWGDPMAVGFSDVIAMGAIALLVVIVVTAMYHPLRLVSFDPVVAAAMGLPVMMFHYLIMGLLSATVVTGIKTTGVILVVAMVITPASAAYQLTDRFWKMLVLSAGFGAFSAVAGTSLAFIVNAPTGPSMVVVASLLFLLAMLLSPTHGVVFDAWRRWRLGRHIAAEDMLKAMYHHNLDPNAVHTHAGLADRVKLSPGRIATLISRLRFRGLVEPAGNWFRLTPAGERRAVEMVRSHRLWESYLAQEANIDAEDVHDLAERLEHAHELADELDASLGHPARDPHGEEIPRPPRDAEQ